MQQKNDLSTNQKHLKYTLGADSTRPSTWVKLVLIEMPHDRNIGSASYLLFRRTCNHQDITKTQT